MPRFRPDLSGLVTYVPGRPIADVAQDLGIEPSEIVKLASNESPDGAFPGVAEAVATALLQSNRYPDNDTSGLPEAIADELDVTTDQVWLGAGSTGLLTNIAYAMGGPGTSAVFAWPSFIMYRIISRWAMAGAIEVPLSEMAHDLGAMRSAVRNDTTVVYVCNPNNPTGTIVPGHDLEEFVGSMPESVLTVVDEAYHHFVDDPSYRTLVPLASNRPNVVVLRTFSKIYGLAAHRVGYAIGTPETLENLRRTQPPFTVTSVSQAAALASLGQSEEIERRRMENSSGRHHLLGVLVERGVEHVPSQTNFIYFRLGPSSAATGDLFLERGVIVRPMSRGWVRVTVGNADENERFVTALDHLLDAVSTG